MAKVAGLRVYDKNGNITLNIGDRICKYIGEGDTGLENGSLQNDLLIGAPLPWIVPIEFRLATGNLNLSSSTTPDFKIDQKTGTLSWTFAESYSIKMGYKFIYGVC